MLHTPPKSFACQDVNDMQRRKQIKIDTYVINEM